jgi:cation/acetate symporter
VGLPFDQLPTWIANWSKLDPSLVSVTDINKDGILQLSEFRISSDLVMLATPEIAGLPYVVSGMVAAGGLAAALSTADGLLLTISNALSHDAYHKMLAPEASSTRRVTISKVLLLVAALAAAALATQKPAGILFLVTAAFSIAASALFPALVMGFFWSRANRWGAVLGMGSGLAITLYYLIRNESWLRSMFGISAAPDLWFGIQPVSAGVFGVPVGFLVCGVVSLLTQAPSEAQRRFVRRLRYPRQV